MKTINLSVGDCTFLGLNDI